ncbi:MAG TPA: AAA family ATPase [Ottowia sp.]|uniref:AAA family ATPase n=1 Tax=Ottowia sp. TaxID=1898956 RepID=UPI002B9E9CA0|nr:AAA family ATPase [Ottowia sp.]HMN20197.1 AAA family ATPase [Ottowia sp.]
MMTPDIERARAALAAIPADLPRDEWVQAGMAAQAAGLDFDAFNDWSAQAGNYNARDARDTWRSFKPGKGIGAGTLFRMAAEHGHHAADKPQQKSPSKAPSRPVAAIRRSAAGQGAAEVWARCEPVSDQHPYAHAKRLSGEPLAGLRQTPHGDSLRIAGQSVAGWLVVPAHGADGELQSLQFIPPPGVGKKLNLPGASMAGARFTVGTPELGQPVYLAEGIGAAWACWQATGCAAVCCFGWGNVARVAADLRQRDASASLVLIPDTGKEADADEIAREHDCLVAKLPDGRPDNFDANDYAQTEDGDALAQLLEQASEPPSPLESHPLAQFVEPTAEPVPPRWLLPGFIAEGLAVVAGGHGFGKTTALLPLALAAAGIHEPGYPLAPKHWRHVVYVTEDVPQAQRIIAGLTSWLGVARELVAERLHLVEARRLPPQEVAQVGALYRRRFTRTAQGVELPPLVVLDTQAAVLAVESENDNAELSAAIAALKQQFAGLPVWLVAHVAKAAMNRSDALSARGASAIEGDAHQVLFLVKEGTDHDATRWLVRGKTRFEARWPELQVHSYIETVQALDAWGEPEELALRWAIARPPEGTRRELADKARQEARQREESELRMAVRDAVQMAWQEGHPLSRRGLRGKVRGKTAEVAGCIEALLSESWLVEIHVPAKERANPARSNFLVNLTTDERDALRRGEPLPTEKTAVPESWKKPIPLVPEPEAENEPESEKEATE